MSQYPPIPGDPVRLERRAGELVMLGPAKPKSSTGKVTVAGNPCTVEYPVGSGVTALLQANPLYTPALNDLVVINWETGGSVSHKLAALPSVVVPGAAGGAGAVRYHPAPFTAQDSGSVRFGSWWTSLVRSSENNSGCWFYGSKIKDTIPDAAVINSAFIYLPLQSADFDSPQLGYHTLAAKPAGALTINAPAALEPRSGWVAIPTTLIDFLKANTGGLGFQAGFSDTIWSGVSTDGNSGALDITYTV
ncbi:MAG: hypothetical protein ABJB03_00560 [Rhodoglobus sp.]